MNENSMVSGLKSNAPIGIFDSGVGGLTVAHAIHKVLPHEQLVYFGDTAHLPYGDKSKASIIHYSEEITRFLISKGAKVIVIACNSASSAAYQEVLEVAKGKAHVINVIAPVVRYISKRYQSESAKIGLVGTKQTVNSGVYELSIAEKSPNINLKSLATPLFVPVIEEGFCNTNISHEVVREYLSREVLSGIKSLILGCTHYPLLKSEIEDFYGTQEQQNVEILDSASIVALALKELLEEQELLFNPEEEAGINRGVHHFYVSEYTKAFEESTHLFFGEKIKLEPIRMW